MEPCHEIGSGTLDAAVVDPGLDAAGAEAVLDPEPEVVGGALAKPPVFAPEVGVPRLEFEFIPP
jgi:hypothetical protein